MQKCPNGVVLFDEIYASYVNGRYKLFCRRGAAERIARFSYITLFKLHFEMQAVLVFDTTGKP